MTIFEELTNRVAEKRHSNFHLDKLDWATSFCIQELCNIIDEKLAGLANNNNHNLSDGKVYLAFELSMPSNNSWNSKWTGEDKKYIITRQIDDPEAAVIYNHAPYWHDFQNNWIAQVDITRITNF